MNAAYLVLLAGAIGILAGVARSQRLAVVAGFGCVLGGAAALLAGIR